MSNVKNVLFCPILSYFFLFFLLFNTTMAQSANIKEIRNLDKQVNITLAQRSFWQFCAQRSPDFYVEGRRHVEDLCNTLQALYERRIVKCNKKDPWMIAESKPDTPHYTCTRLMINMPPRHGKSRTLVNFTAWIFGKNNRERVITCSYNDDEAQDFSRYTRDTIQEERSDIDPDEIVYEDIFPDTKIKKGDASYRKWALSGQFFNYKGAGLGGSITGKGGSLTIIDDPIKGAEEAYNENHLNKVWRWYTGTFLSRKEEGGLEIINHTRWSKLDPCGRILASEDGPDWYVFRREAYDTETNTMLCKDLLSRESYEHLRRNMDEAIFIANYHQQPIDLKGRLYKTLNTYTDYPYDEAGNILFERIIAYVDTADQGDDYLCAIVAGVYQKECWILDVYYTKAGMETTEPETALLLARNGVSFAKLESNNGGRGFARAVGRELKTLEQTHGSNYCNAKSILITWFHQGGNKKARILAASNYVMQHFYFPHNWASRWGEFFKDIVGYQKEGKNTHDDGPDALTGLAEMIDYKGSIGVILNKQQSEIVRAQREQDALRVNRDTEKRPTLPGPLHPDTKRT